jgi:hypothetical protein
MLRILQGKSLQKRGLEGHMDFVLNWVATFYSVELCLNSSFASDVGQDIYFTVTQFPYLSYDGKIKSCLSSVPEIRCGYERESAASRELLWLLPS